MPSFNSPPALLGRAPLLAAALLTSATMLHAAEPFSFALLSDGPYGADAEPAYERLVRAVNAEQGLRFVVHAGDVKAGGEMCSDELLARRHALFQTFEPAFVLTPGDNDWTDCHRTSNGGYLPTERLDFVRSLFFSEPGTTGGRNPMAVTTQAATPGREAFVENTLFEMEGVVFSQVHVVGSNNDLAPWSEIDASDTVETPRADRLAEFETRNAASLEWLEETFARATANDAAGVFVTIHANPRFDLARGDPDRAGFDGFLDALLDHAERFGKPVVLAHGDFHVFSIDTPRLVPFYANADAESAADNRQVANLVRVQGFGDSENHWVEIDVDAADPAVFRFAPRIVVSNALPPSSLRLRGSVYSSTALELFWERLYVDGAQLAYEIYRDGELLATTGGISWFEEGLQPGTSYAYEIVAVSSKNESYRCDATISLRTRQR